MTIINQLRQELERKYPGYLSAAKHMGECERVVHEADVALKTARHVVAAFGAGPQNILYAIQVLDSAFGDGS